MDVEDGCSSEEDKRVGIIYSPMGKQINFSQFKEENKTNEVQDSMDKKEFRIPRPVAINDSTEISEESPF